MRTKRVRLLSLIVIVMLVAPFAGTPQATNAEVPLALQVNEGDTIASLATMHVISVGDLLKANPQLVPPYRLATGDWLALPSWARTTNDELFTVTASSEWELAGVLSQLQDVRNYRMMGRVFHLGVSQGKRVLVYSCEGARGNPGNSVTIAASRFNQRPFVHIGVGGGGHGTRIGDMIVSGGAIPTGTGNIAPLLLPAGNTIIGYFWSYYWGVPIISDAGRTNALLLRPSPSFLQQVYGSFAKVTLPPVNQDVADYMTNFFGQSYDRYIPSWLKGWSISGDFVTSDQYLTQTEARAAILAAILGVPVPQAIGTDMETADAVLAYMETGGTDWFTVRIVVDEARELQGQGTPAGVPWNEQNDPSQPYAWSYANNPYYISDWSYFQDVPAMLVNQAIADLGRTPATASPTNPRKVVPNMKPPDYLVRRGLINH